MASPVRMVGALAAIAAGLGGMAFTVRSGAKTTGPEAAVYLAMQPIPVGTKITSAMLGVYKVPLAAVSSTMIRVGVGQSPIGGYATTNVPAYSYLYQGEVSTSRQWAYGIPPGMQAIDVTVAQSSLAGVVPGEYVSLYGQMGSSRQVVELLNSVQVLGLYTSQLTVVGEVPQASGGLFGGGASSSGSGTPSIVRFAVTPEQAAIQTQAMESGGNIYVVQGSGPAPAPSSPPPASKPQAASPSGKAANHGKSSGKGAKR
jgi:Flp pilus assembly protein CpaB